MTTPTLAEFADLFARAKALWPDAPGLPKGYRIDAFDEMHCGQGTPPVPTAAAIALCCSTVRAIGAWWQQQDSLDRYCYIGPERASGWIAHVSIYGYPTPVFDNFTTDEAAHLAALRAVVEWGEKTKVPHANWHPRLSVPRRLPERHPPDRRSPGSGRARQAGRTLGRAGPDLPADGLYRGRTHRACPPHGAAARRDRAALGLGPITPNSRDSPWSPRSRVVSCRN